jgi:hypothetical protein
MMMGGDYLAAFAGKPAPTFDCRALVGAGLCRSELVWERACPRKTAQQSQ